MKKGLLDKISQRKAVVGVIGLGYVGLPLAACFLEEGFPVVGFDIDPAKPEALAQGKRYIEHIDVEIFQKSMPEKRFIATCDFSLAKESDILILCVPTPLNKNREPDLTYVVNSLETMIPFLRKGQAIILESTTYPGTTDEVLRPRLEEMGFTIGEDSFLIYSPEREDPKNPDFSTRTIPKVCGGTTAACLEVGVALYEAVIDQVVPVSSTQVAEMSKILENTYRAVNIALVNELKIVADRMGLDIFEVINAAKTKPFGFTAFYPGPGLGGHCIPIDPFYLTWKAREYDVNTRFIELAGEVNTAMPLYVIGKVIEGLNSVGKPLKDSRVLILGFAYKKNVDDTRESPSAELMEQLLKRGAKVSFSDPHVPELKPMRAYHFKQQKSVALTPASLSSFDCVVVSTNHDAFDWPLIKAHAPLIIDTRGVFTADGEKILRA
ncbi:nucleotide sugar dehydrogenase [Magnetococcales bacterium HHB-1]